MPPKVDFQGKKEKYQKKDPITHILDRPDMYVGSLSLKNCEEYIYNDETEKIEKRFIDYSPALLRVFIEPISNVLDNIDTSIKEGTPTKEIKIDINRENGSISIYNDGHFVPIEKNREGVYYHSMIFGELLTSSNYDDTEERTTSGRNGLGVKLANIFSNKFTVTGIDTINGKKLVQEWGRNMRDTNGPKVTNSKVKKGYTKVEFTPDYLLFGLEGITDDIYALFSKYVYETAMLAETKLVFNGKKINIKGLKEYALLYALSDEKKEIVYHKIEAEKDSSEIIVIPSDDFEGFSFVNGLSTFRGGVHLNSWSKAVFGGVLEKYNKKNKDCKLTLKDVKNCFKIFLKCRVINPRFDSQEKGYLEYPNVTVDFPDTKINTMLRWENTKRLDNIVKIKTLDTMNKAIKTKTKRVKIPGLDHSNKTGVKCTLILCEGNSAKPYAVSGIHVGVDGKKGRDFFGILPLRGKILNVRNSNPNMIAKNEVLTNIIKSLNLKYNLDYSIDKNYNTLNYGKLMILCDSDVDGIHISCLIINVFHYLFPSLLERDPSFITSMQTPILRVFQGKNSRVFYSQNAYKKYRSNLKIIPKVKYYKGLGTSSTQEVKETFGKKMLHYTICENTVNVMEKTFGKDTDSRKQWLLNYSPDTDPITNEEGDMEITIGDYVDNKLIEYSIDDCKRSIPNLYDGLKESQRKILFTTFTRSLDYQKNKVLKVVQLAGSVAENTSYHHGENNLCNTIIKMAQCFVGTNNIPLLYRDGQFGSRLNDKDAAKPRYIFTKLDRLTRYLFPKDDDDLLEYLEDDGQKIEPKYYVPIIPMILVNGCSGIGTGWSSNIPNYNPIDICNAVKTWISLDGHIMEIEGKNIVSYLEELHPWYRGFKGDIEKKSENVYTCRGKMSVDNKGNKVVTEIPVGKWIDSTKEHFENLQSDKVIKSFTNHSTMYSPHFTIKEAETQVTLESLKLVNTIRTSNMVLFTNDSKLSKYNSIDKIIDIFCKKRLELYIQRKSRILSDYNDRLKWTSYKRKFLEEVMNEELVLNRRDEKDIITDLINREYPPEDDGKYTYLLDMPVKNFSKQMLEKLDKEKEEIEKNISALKKKTVQEIWLKEIDDFLEEYLLWVNDINDKENN